MSKFEKKITDSGDYTLFNHEYQEYYHHLIGSKVEADLKYLRPFLLNYEEMKEPVKVLDPFFGLGFNTFIFLNYFLSQKKTIIVDVIEIDSDLEFYWNESLNYFSHLKNTYKSFSHLKKETFFSLVIGDMLDQLGKCGESYYDVILHDAFTYYKCPELWSVNLFKNYYEILCDEGMILTYSSSKIVRAGLIEAGFSLSSIQAVGKKKGGTIAIKRKVQHNEKKIQDDYDNKLNIPYYDYSKKELSLDQRRKEIIENQKLAYDLTKNHLS